MNEQPSDQPETVLRGLGCTAVVMPSRPISRGDKVRFRPEIDASGKIHTVYGVNPNGSIMLEGGLQDWLPTRFLHVEA